jgi:hypothetical protein
MWTFQNRGGDALTVVDGEVDVPENGNLRSPRVEEVNVVQVDSACEFRADDTLGFVGRSDVELEKSVQVVRSLYR